MDDASRPRHRRPFPAVLTCAVAFALILAATSLQAQETTWTGATGSWFGVANWSDGVPAPGSATASVAAIDNGGTAQVGAPGAAAANQLLLGAIINVDTGAIEPTGSGNVIVNGAGATLTVRPNVPSLAVVQGTVTVENGGSLDTGSTEVGTVTPTVTPPADPPESVTIEGAGSKWTENGTLVIGTATGLPAVATVTISDGASFAGAETVTIGFDGELEIGTGGLAGTFVAPSIINDDLISFDFTDRTTLSAAVSGTGFIENIGPGTLTLAGINSYSGGTFIDDGNVVAAANSALGTNFVDVLGATSVLQINAGTSQTNFVTLNPGATLVNFGSLLAPATEGASSTVTVFNDGTVTNEAGASITNPNAGGIAIQAVTEESEDQVTVTNAGTIAGTIGIQLLDGVTGTITNTSTGVITGTGGTAIDASTGGAVTFSNAGHVNGSVILADFANTASLFTGGSIAGNLNLGSPTSASLIFDGAGTQLLSQAVTGTITNFNSLTKQGTGTWIIDETLAYTGGATIGAGTLQLGNGGTTGSIPGNVIDNGILAFDRTDTVSFAGVIGGTGAVIQNGAGRVMLTAANTYSGGTNFNAGILAVTSDGNLGTGALSFNGGTLEALAAGGGITSSKAVTLDAGGGTFLGDTGTTSTLSGAISGVGSLTKDGGGTLILTGTDAYGGTTINAGTLQIGAGGITGSITGSISNDGTLVFDRSDSVTFNGAISGTGDLVQQGGGTLILTGNSTYTGGTTVNAGVLQVGNGGTTGSISGNVTDNGTLAFDRSDSVTFVGVVSGSGSLLQSGGGTLTLAGNNTYSGGTGVNSGTLIAAANNALGSGAVTVNDSSLLRIDPGVTITNFVQLTNGGGLDNAGLIQVAAVSGGPAAAVTTSGGATITNEAGATISGIGQLGIKGLNGPATISNSGTISGAADGIDLAGGGSVTNNAGGVITGTSGPAILSSGASTKISNAGTINGNVNLGNFANTVQLFSGGRINGNLNLGTSAASNLILDGAGEQTFSQAVTGTTSNAGSLTKQGSGNWILDVAMNAPVSTNILAGVLTVNSSLTSPEVTVQTGGMLKGSGVLIGNVVNLGTISPGNSPGTLTITGNFTQGSAGTYNVQIFSLQDYSRLIISGHASLDGTLHLTLASGFQLTPGEKFTVLTAGQGISGTFRTVSSNTPVNVTYANGIVDVNAISTAKVAQPQIHLSDGTPFSTTALIADYTFYGFGSLSERLALGLLPTEETGKDSAISVTFDAGEFDIEGQHGETYTIPIAGGFKINDRVRLDYEIPLQYLTIDDTGLFQAGLTLDLPVKVVIPSADQPWSWIVTPTAAVATSGSREIIGGGALTNVFSYQWHGITATYGNYISFFEGDVSTTDNPKFPTGVNQQIMKNGLRLDVPFAGSWIIEAYGIYTQFFQSAAIGNYYTIGAEVGHHFTWNVEGRNLDLGYLSLGLYTEFGNHYSSGHIQIGSAWRF